MQPQPNPKTLLIKLLAVIAVILLIVFGITVYNANKFRVLSTNPGLGNITTNTPSVSINFSKQISSSGTVVSIAPNILKSSSVSGKSLILELNYPSLTNQTYTITLRLVTAVDGSTLQNVSLTFRAQYAPISGLPQTKQQQIVQSQDQNQGPSQDPIMQYLPYSATDFSLDGIISEQSGKSVLTLQATLYLSQADMSDEQSAIAQKKQEVISYIQSLGLNPANYNITYSASAP